MLALILKVLLLVEICAYGLIAAWLARLGLGIPAAASAMVCLALAARIGYVAWTFFLTSMLAPLEPAAQSCGSRSRLVLTETFWTTVAFTVLAPFPELFRRSGPGHQPLPGAIPVLLVHGFLCNGAIWWPMRRQLEAQGYPTWVVDLDPIGGDIDAYTGAIDTRIEAILATTGAKSVIVIAHSMGGLAMRAYLRARGGARVAKLLMLGSPHHGTVHARAGIFTNVRQMQPGSAWLRELARAEAAGPAAPTVSIYTVDDNIVVPQESAALEGAKNVRLAGVGHVSLAFDAKVRDIVLAEIRGGFAA